MAYPTRGRDPFLDAGTQAFLERRGVEALGLFVSAVGVAFALALASYAPEDSAWISAGGPEIQNWRGQIGAIVAAPLIKIMGLRRRCRPRSHDCPVGELICRRMIRPYNYRR